ncbi:MAG: hypothetical protein AAGB93_18350 [Planctomycetota bacterium]
MLLPALAALALSLLASCVSTSSDRLGAHRYPAAHRGADVAVYEVLSDIDAHVVKVGIVRVEASAGVSWARRIDSLRSEARRLGANAIVLERDDDDARTTALAVRVHADETPVLISSALGVE